MGWNYEVEEVKEVKMVSKEGAKQDFIDDLEQFGVKKAISNMVKEMEIAELVRNEKPAKRIEQCDNAYRLINFYFYAILDGISKELPYRIRIESRDILADNDGTEKSINIFSSNLETEIKKAIQNTKAPISNNEYDVYVEGLDISQRERNKIKQEMIASAREQKKKEAEYLSALLGVKNGKSVFKIFFEQINLLIKIYCKETKKNESTMRKYIFETVVDAHNAFENERHTVDSFFQSIALSINGAKHERIERPFTYFFDVN